MDEMDCDELEALSELLGLHSRASNQRPSAKRDPPNVTTPNTNNNLPPTDPVRSDTPDSLDSVETLKDGTPTWAELDERRPYWYTEREGLGATFTDCHALDEPPSSWRRTSPLPTEAGPPTRKKLPSEKTTMDSKDPWIPSDMSQYALNSELAPKDHPTRLRRPHSRNISGNSTPSSSSMRESPAETSSTPNRDQNVNKGETSASNPSTCPPEKPAPPSFSSDKGELYWGFRGGKIPQPPTEADKTPSSKATFTKGTEASPASTTGPDSDLKATTSGESPPTRPSNLAQEVPVSPTPRARPSPRPTPMATESRDFRTNQNKGTKSPPSTVEPRPVRHRPDRMRCFNCWERGHAFPQCSKPEAGPFCTKCGKRWVKTEDCPRCPLSRSFPKKKRT